MKTSLAIVLATIALTFGAMLSFTSGVEAQNYGNLSGKIWAYSAVQIQAPLRAPGPRPLSWQSLGCEMCQPASPWGGSLVFTRSNGSAKCGSPRQIR